MGQKCLLRFMHQDIMLWIEERASLLSPLPAALSRPRPCVVRFTTSRGYHPCAIHKWLCLF